MQITVLKARRLINSIDGLLKNIIPSQRDRFRSRSENDGKHYIYSNVENAEKTGDEKVAKIISDYFLLTEVKYKLRLLVSDFNKTSEINNLQNKSKRIEEGQKALNEILKTYNSPLFNSVNSSFSEGCSNTFLEDLKIRVLKSNSVIQSITDQCNAINVNNNITLATEQVRILTDYNLLD